MSSPEPSEMMTALVGRMRGRDEPDDRPSEVLQMFQGVARWIPHAISPFMDLQGAMCSALPTSIVTAFTAGAVYLANWGVTTSLTASMTVNALMTGIPWRRNLWASLAGGNFVLSSLNQT